MSAGAVLVLPRFMAVAQCVQLLELLQGATWQPGRGGAQKRNLEATGEAAREVGRVVGEQLAESPAFQLHAWPAHDCAQLVNRFEVGHEYGDHFDHHTIGGRRSDMSYTLLLEAPELGGELVIEGQPIPIGLGAGTLVVYPSTSLHRVARVEQGRRTAVVGWVQSRMRYHEQREVMKALQVARGKMRSGGVDVEDVDRAFHALARMWWE